MKLHFEENIRHRKHWELAYTYHALHHYNFTVGKRGVVLGEIRDSLVPYLVSQGIYLTTIEDTVPQSIWEKESVQNKIMRLKPSWLQEVSDKKFLEMIEFKSADLRNLPRYGG
jgi:hypothetical protein